MRAVSECESESERGCGIRMRRAPDNGSDQSQSLPAPDPPPPTPHSLPALLSRTTHKLQTDLEGERWRGDGERGRSEGGAREEREEECPGHSRAVSQSPSPCALRAHEAACETAEAGDEGGGGGGSEGRRRGGSRFIFQRMPA
eukprot:613115-Rhodomonas_salina.2